MSRSGNDDESRDVDQSSIGLDANHTIFAGYAKRGALREAEARRQIAASDYQDIRAEVGEQVRSAFARLLFAQEQLLLTRVIADRRGQNADLVALRFQTGKEHKGSHLRSQATFKQALFEVEQTRRRIRTSQRDLAGAMGRSVSDILVASGQLAAGPTPDVPDFRRIVLDTPRYRKAAEAIKAAEAGVTVANSPFYPELGAFASVARTGDDWRPEDNSWSFGFSLGFSFFDGRQDYHRVHAAKAEVRRQEAELKRIASDLLLELESAWADVQDATELIAVQKSFLEAAELRAEIGRSQYTGGSLSFEDWDVIEEELINARKNVLSTMLEAELALAAWDRVRGASLLPDL